VLPEPDPLPDGGLPALPKFGVVTVAWVEPGVEGGGPPWAPLPDVSPELEVLPVPDVSPAFEVPAFPGCATGQLLGGVAAWLLGWWPEAACAAAAVHWPKAALAFGPVPFPPLALAELVEPPVGFPALSAGA
jgi:hypothetical protein